MKTDDGGHPSIAGAPAAGPSLSADLRTPTLALRLDEAAVAYRGKTLVRTAIYLPAGVMALLVLPWPWCLTWLAGGLIVEIWSWFATLAQSNGRSIDRRTRANFLANLVTTNVWWLLLGVACWRSGGVAGQACAAVLLLGICAVSVLLFRMIPLTLLAAGMAPATGALTILALADGRGWAQLLPIWIALGLAALFTVTVAADTPSFQTQQRQINDSLTKYKILADNVIDVIGRVDLQGRYQYISPASLTVLGYRPEELIGTPVMDLLQPESGPAMAAAVARMLADPTRSEVVTARTRHKDGRWLWVQTNAKLILENGVAVATVGVSRDITQSVLADIALQTAKAEAEAANRAKADFLANVSHEIRTPMNAVLGALHLLESEDISPEGRELMRQAGDCGRMLSQLLNDVLDFSKIESGQMELAPEPIDAGNALQSVAALLGPEARGKGVDLRCEVTGADLWIEADPVRLRQAMFNLVGNAVKFTVEGQVTARLDLTPLPDGRRHVRLEIEDTGIGMAPSVQGHLFERFRQADGATTRRFGGTGLGLSITRALAHMMGGEIGFTSIEDKGSTFWLVFNAPAAQGPVQVRAGEGMLGGVNILLVEDNATNRLVARTMLDRLGANVEEAEDGVIGLAAARRGAYDLILMDIQMPHMDGIEATRAIRGLHGQASTVPIIGLTANVMAHQSALYRAAGMNGVVAKPISPAALLSEIALVLATEDASLAG
jgi:PAS domain S-box-containing protein